MNTPTPLSKADLAAWMTHALGEPRDRHERAVRDLLLEKWGDVLGMIHADMRGNLTTANELLEVLRDVASRCGDLHDIAADTFSILSQRIGAEDFTHPSQWLAAFIGLAAIHRISRSIREDHPMIGTTWRTAPWESQGLGMLWRVTDWTPRKRQGEAVQIMPDGADGLPWRIVSTDPPRALMIPLDADAADGLYAEQEFIDDNAAQPQRAQLTLWQP
jgi:hypothetical protein